jgi:hypothetical protein
MTKPTIRNARPWTARAVVSAFQHGRGAELLEVPGVMQAYTGSPEAGVCHSYSPEIPHPYGGGSTFRAFLYDAEARVIARALNKAGHPREASVPEPPPGRPTDPVPPAIVPPPAPDPHPADVLAERLLFARDRASVDQLEGGTGLNPHELLGHFGSLGFPPWWAARFTAALLLEAVRDPAAP